MERLSFLPILLASGLLFSDEKAKNGETTDTVEGPIVSVVRIDSHPIVLHTERKGIRFGESKKVLSYAEAGMFLFKFIAESESTRDIVAYQHEKAVIKQEDDFFQRLSAIAQERQFKVIVFSTDTGKFDAEFDKALESFLVR